MIDPNLRDLPLSSPRKPQFNRLWCGSISAGADDLSTSLILQPWNLLTNRRPLPEPLFLLNYPSTR